MPRSCEFGGHEAASPRVTKLQVVSPFGGSDLVMQATPELLKPEWKNRAIHVHSEEDVGEAEPCRYSRECHPPSTFWRQGTLVLTSL